MTLRGITVGLALLALGSTAYAAPGSTSDSHFTDLEFPRYGAAVVADGNHIYVLGGTGRTMQWTPVERIDVSTGEVTIEKWLPQPRRYHAANLMDGEVWIFGGEHRNKTISDVEVIELSSGVGEIRAQWKIPRKGVKTVRMDDRIWIFGGLASDDAQDTRGAMLEIFNPQNLTSKLGTDLPEPIETRPVIANGKVYLVGGWDPIEGTRKSLYVLGEDETWHPLADLPLPTSAHTAVADDAFIYTFGDYKDLSRVSRYHIAEDRWDLIEVPYTPRRHAVAMVVDDHVYVIGGNVATRGSALGIVEAFRLTALRDAPVISPPTPQTPAPAS